MMFSNETTQESMRDKYQLWGNNPYDMGSCKNLKYFFTTQESLVFIQKSEEEI